MQSVKWAWSSSEVCKWDGLFQMGSVCMRVKRTDVPVFPSNARIVQLLQRNGIFTQRDGDYSRAGGWGGTVVCGESCLESNILSSKWRRCCSCGACGDSAGGWIPSPPPASCNNSVPFSPLNDHSLNGLISVGGTLWRNYRRKCTCPLWKPFIAFLWWGNHSVLPYRM